MDEENKSTYSKHSNLILPDRSKTTVLVKINGTIVNLRTLLEVFGFEFKVNEKNSFAMLIICSPRCSQKVLQSFEHHSSFFPLSHNINVVLL
jgi:hypothetical protein